MKKITALVAFAGLNYSAGPGQEITCSDEFAADMIRAGYAVASEEDKKEPEPEQKPKKTARKKKVEE